MCHLPGLPRRPVFQTEGPRALSGAGPGAAGDSTWVHLGLGPTELGDEKDSLHPSDCCLVRTQARVWLALAFLGCENLGCISSREVCTARLVTDMVCGSELDDSCPLGERPWGGVLFNKVVSLTPGLAREFRGRKRIWVGPDSKKFFTQLSKSLLLFFKRPLRLPTVDLVPQVVALAGRGHKVVPRGWANRCVRRTLWEAGVGTE